jgi:type I restriction enzyme, S subunit
MIPEGWKQELAHDLCSQISVGIVVKPADYYVDKASGIRAFRSANVGEGFVKDRDWIYISEEGHRINRKSVLRTNDVLIVRTGYPGTACLVPPEYEGSNCIDIIFARPKPDRIIPSYLCLFTNSEYGKKQVLDGQGGLAQQHFNVGAFKEIKIPLPPLPEQRRITEILSTWDRAIETVEALIANARAQKKALMQSLLTGKRRLPGFSGSTRFVSLSEVARIETGSSNREDSLDIGEFTFFDRSTDVRRSDRFLFDAEAIIIGGEGQEFIPKYFVGKFDLHQRAYALHSFNNAFGRYIFYAAHHSRHLLRRYAVGSTVASLRMPTFQKVKIWLPSVEEQIAIADHLTLADDGLEGLSTQLTALRQEKSALMQQLLTGKRRVKLTDSDHF